MDQTKLGKYSIKYSNSNEYHTLKREIWGQDIYYFELSNPSPYIVDIGSHIGVSILYFKNMYPNSTVIGFEPNPISFNLLSENIQINMLENVQIFNKAISKEEGTKPFYINANDSGWESNASFLKNGWTGKEKTKEIEIGTTRLDKYITRDIDILKIDTEGSELSILKSHKSLLSRIHNIAIEYHPIKENGIDNILNILTPLFDIQIFEDGKQIKKIPENRLLTIKGKKRK